MAKHFSQSTQEGIRGKNRSSLEGMPACYVSTCLSHYVYLVKPANRWFVRNKIISLIVSSTRRIKRDAIKEFAPLISTLLPNRHHRLQDYFRICFLLPDVSFSLCFLTKRTQAHETTPSEISFIIKHHKSPCLLSDNISINLLQNLLIKTSSSQQSADTTHVKFYPESCLFFLQH